jgi:alpha-beta hydrolase superfamily lysophospholipase
MSTVDSPARPVVIPTADGLRLHATCWPQPEPRGVVVIAHGFGEHGGCYAHVAAALGQGVGVDVVAVDLRGHGRSPGRRGVVRAYDDLVADLLAVHDWAGRERPGLPRFILGHSNGGQLALRAALDRAGGPGPDGLILSNPSLRLSFPVPRHKVALGRLLLRFAPGVTLPAPIEPEKLSRDPAMLPFYTDDPLRHERMSAPFFFGMIEGGERLLARVASITIPVLMIVGGNDPVVDPAACRLAFDRLGSVDKTLLLYPHMLHEPFNDLGRAGVLADLVAWLDREMAPASPPARRAV